MIKKSPKKQTITLTIEALQSLKGGGTGFTFGLVVEERTPVFTSVGAKITRQPSGVITERRTLFTGTRVLTTPVKFFL